MVRSGSSGRKPVLGYGDILVQDDSMCCSCTPSWVKTFLIFFTAIILVIVLKIICTQVIALSLIGLAGFFLFTRLSYVPVVLGEIAYVANFLLFVIGLLLMIACIIGFVGVATRNHSLLITVSEMF